MSELTMTETYMLLVLNATSKYSNLLDCQYSAGVVLGGIYDLLQNGYVSTDRSGKLGVSKKPNTEFSFARTLYEGIQARPSRTINKWLDTYCFSATSKAVQPVINDSLQALADQGLIQFEKKRALFGTKVRASVNAMQAAPFVDAFKNNVVDGTSDEAVIFSVQMLLLADVFKAYFPMGKRMAIKSTLNSYKKSNIWRTMEPYVDRVQNFNYQNTVYTGASQ